MILIRPETAYLLYMNRFKIFSSFFPKKFEKSQNFCQIIKKKSKIFGNEKHAIFVRANNVGKSQRLPE